LEGKIYRLLVNLKYEMNGSVKGSSPMKSILSTIKISIRMSSNSNLILERIQRELIKFEEEYDL
jgi:hypothetical protein